jgi:hypothetical protein
MPKGGGGEMRGTAREKPSAQLKTSFLVRSLKVVTPPPPLCAKHDSVPAFPPHPGAASSVADAQRQWAGAGLYFLRLCLVAGGISATTYGYQVILGSPGPGIGRYAFQFPTHYFLYGAVFLTATTFLRRREWVMAAALLPCLHYLYATCPALVPYCLALAPFLYFLLGNDPRPGKYRSILFWCGLLGGVVLLPKAIQTGFHLEHGSWLDVNQNLFTGLFLRYAYYFYERQRGLVPPGRFWEHLAYMLFIPQITGMLNFPPSEMGERWGFEFRALRRGFVLLGWVVLEIPVVLWLEQTALPAWGYSRGYVALRAAPLGGVWACLLLSYLYWALLESTKFNLMVALFRFFGVNVDDNFNFPLLATSPVQLWRRWNIYNRKLLLKFVYFPLGGNRRHVYRNILLTFLASALLLHTGFLGSPWWSCDPGQLRDWVLYFAGQGLLVCGAYWWQNRPFWERLPGMWRWPLAGLGWTFTILSSAWLHVLPLGANLFTNAPPAASSLSERCGLMLRALGL